MPRKITLILALSLCCIITVSCVSRQAHVGLIGLRNDAPADIKSIGSILCSDESFDLAFVEKIFSVKLRQVKNTSAGRAFQWKGVISRDSREVAELTYTNSSENNENQRGENLGYVISELEVDRLQNKDCILIDLVKRYIEPISRVIFLQSYGNSYGFVSKYDSHRMLVLSSHLSHSCFSDAVDSFSVVVSARHIDASNPVQPWRR